MYRINGTASLRSLAFMQDNNANLHNSLVRLSSGLRINSAFDDASGMAISNNLNSSANTLIQAVSNANDAIGILSIADKAIDEQIKILDQIKIKATQATQDGQNQKTRTMILNDINRLLDALDDIANNTNYNGMSLLNGSFVNKKFQIGSSSNTTVNVNINSTLSRVLGNTQFSTGSTILAGISGFDLNISGIYSNQTYKISSVQLGTEQGQGIGNLAEEINKISDKTGVRASYQVQMRGNGGIKAGRTSSNFSINGVTIGIVEIKAGDSDGTLVAAINSKSLESGVRASLDEHGNLVLDSIDGRGIKVEDDGHTVQNLVGFDGVIYVSANAAAFLATKENDIAINGESIDAANNIEEFIQNVNMKADKTGVGARLNGNELQLIQLNQDTKIEITGDNITKIGVQVSTFKGQEFDLNNSIYRPNHSANNLISRPQIEYITDTGEKKLIDCAYFTPSSNHTYNAKDIVESINATTAFTGFSAFLEKQENGKYKLCISAPENVRSITNIYFGKFANGDSGTRTEFGFGGVVNANSPATSTIYESYGELTLSSSGMGVSINASFKGESSNAILGRDEANIHETNLSLEDIVKGNLDQNALLAIGNKNGNGAGLNLQRAMALMDVSENAITSLSQIRSDIGSATQQLSTTINNISVNTISLKSAVSTIQDADFADLSTQYARENIVSQAQAFIFNSSQQLKDKLFTMLFSA
ncbi:flagellin hook IN motif-containing protein [Campylobacter jejuni]|uniref:flagellin N-terminal helical domain-containing protein n=1 Tax=Campylobacter jejuni TaxID=197 RepID=UPI0006ACB6F2|nr:flagellin hook IN motif-containing protein [Campylobacter jejuni]